MNRSHAEQDQSGPRASRSYPHTVEMIPDHSSHLGYWKEKEEEVKTVHGFELRRGTSWPDAYYQYHGLKVTFQFHRYDGTITNWFMHEYIPTDQSWGNDLYLEVKDRCSHIYWHQNLCYVFFNARF